MPRQLFFWLIMLVSLKPLTAQWLEFGLEGQFSNLYLRPERTPSDSSFDGKSDLYYNGSAYFISEISPGLTVKTGYLSDEVLRRRVFSYITIQQSFVTFTVGPFYGIFNTNRKWFSPGVNLDARLDLPNVLFFTIGFDTNFGPILTDDDYFTSFQGSSFGFYVPFGIITIFANYRTFQTLKSQIIIRDEMVKSGISTEVFFKNFPLRYTGTIEFSALQKDYVNGDTHQIMSLIFGSKIFWEINPGLAFYTIIDASVFSFGWEELNYNVPGNLPVGKVILGTRFRFNTTSTQQQ